MNIARVFKHLVYPPWLVRNKFSPESLIKIEQNIADSEALHSAEIRFAVESSMGFFDLLQDTPCFQRGVDVFSELRIWDTAENNGVLVYLLLADRKVEIVADRGFNEKVSKAEWQHICQLMEKSFAKKQFEAGVIKGIDEITQKVVKFYAIKNQSNPDELPNKPVIL